MLLLELMVNYIAQRNLTLSLPVFMAFFSELEVNTPPVASNMSRSRRKPPLGEMCSLKAGKVRFHLVAVVEISPKFVS